MYKRTVEIDQEEITTLHKGRDSLYAKMACAKKEFASAKHRFFAAIQASRQNESKIAQAELTHSLDYCDGLMKVDIYKNVIKQSQLRIVKRFFKKESSWL